MSGRSPELHVRLSDLTRYPERHPSDRSKTDHVTRDKDAQRYRLREVQPDGEGMLRLILAEVDA